MILPIAVPGRTFGTLTLGRVASARPWGPVEMLTARDLARRAGIALANCSLYQAAQKALAARNEVLGAVSHDLKVPLNTVIGAVALLEDVVHGSEESVRWLEALRRSAEQMKALTENLLDASRIEAREFPKPCAKASSSDSCRSRAATGRPRVRGADSAWRSAAWLPRPTAEPSGSRTAPRVPSSA